MEGQFEDAFPGPVLEKPVVNKSNGCQSEEDVESDWTDEGDYEPDLEDYNWENEIGNFSKKLAAVRSGTQPNSNRRQPLACGDRSKAIGSKTFAVNYAIVCCRVSILNKRKSIKHSITLHQMYSGSNVNTSCMVTDQSERLEPPLASRQQ